MTNENCPDCAAPIGTMHDGGCDVAVCTATGKLRMKCDGYDEDFPQAQYDCGRDIWTGTRIGESK
jgi:hypothetical protein